MSIRYTAAHYAKATDPKLRQLSGMIRRMAVDATRGLWKLLGYRLTDGTDESLSAEAFTGVGFYARPPVSSKAEAVVVYLGGPDHSIVVAARDEKTRQASVGDIAEDESTIFNSKAVLIVKANGAIEARSVGGTAVPLATKADLDALKNAMSAWVPAPNDGGAALRGHLMDLFATWPTGTTKFRAE